MAGLSSRLNACLSEAAATARSQQRLVLAASKSGQRSELGPYYVLTREGFLKDLRYIGTANSTLQPPALLDLAYIKSPPSCNHRVA